MNSKESTDTLILPSLLLQIPESAQQKPTSSLLWALKSGQKAVVMGKKRMSKVPKEPKQSKTKAAPEYHWHFVDKGKEDKLSKKFVPKNAASTKMVHRNLFACQMQNRIEHFSYEPGKKVPLKDNTTCIVWPAEIHTLNISTLDS